MTTTPIVPAADAPDLPGITRPMTYAEYLASPEENARYDILDGYKVYTRFGEEQVTNPTRAHQLITFNLAKAFDMYRRQVGSGHTLMGPCDVLVSRNPLRTRQPDVLFMSEERWQANPSAHTAAPLDPPPELVIEILSPSDTRRVREAKIEDVRRISVQECWLVHIDSELVDVLRLTPEASEIMASYGRGQATTSLAFPGLTVPVEEIFAL
jgi:Uma2 family endonuclease